MQDTTFQAHDPLYPVRLGVDDGRLSRDIAPARIKQLFELLENLGASHVDVYLWLPSSDGKLGESQIARRIARMDELMRWPIGLSPLISASSRREHQPPFPRPYPWFQLYR